MLCLMLIIMKVDSERRMSANLFYNTLAFLFCVLTLGIVDAKLSILTEQGLSGLDGSAKCFV